MIVEVLDNYSGDELAYWNDLVEGSTFDYEGETWTVTGIFKSNAIGVLVYAYGDEKWEYSFVIEIGKDVSQIKKLLRQMYGGTRYMSGVTK